LRLGEIAGSAARTGLASVVAGVVGYFTAELVAGLGQGGALARALPGVAGAVVFATAFILVAYAAKSAELHSLVSSLRKRLRR
jgi:hypothetical protein